MRRLIIHLALLLTLLAPIGLPAFASAACPTDPKSDKENVLYGISGTGGDCEGGGVTNLVATIVNILSLIVGIAAIIVIIISGLKYITSNGATDKVGTAKNTLIYALIGLFIAAIAQLLVHFVLYQSSHLTKTNTPASQGAGSAGGAAGGAASP